MQTDLKPVIRREADIEAQILETIRRLGRPATSAEIWRQIDAAYDVSFEIRRTVFSDLLDRGQLILEEHRDHRLPETTVRLYRLGLFAETPGRSNR